MLICHDLNKIRGRLTEAKECISEVEDMAISHTTQMDDLQVLVSSLVNKIEDAENRQHYNNMQMVEG